MNDSLLILILRNQSIMLHVLRNLYMWPNEKHDYSDYCVALLEQSMKNTDYIIDEFSKEYCK